MTRRKPNSNRQIPPPEPVAPPSAPLGVRLILCAVLFIVPFLLYVRTCSNGYLVLDDDDYVAKNAIVQRGITWEGVKWAFTTDTLANWHPVTWLSYMVDCQVFGTNPAAQHIINAFIHAVNSLLLFLVLERLTRHLASKPFWACAFVAALFALHPLHVESVAWISERKDVLSAFFWILSMGAYAWYTVSPSLVRYVSLATLFAVGLMAKPVLVTLPCVLLLLDYWPLGRFRSPFVKNTVRLVVEKVPLFALTLASSIVTFVVQREGGAMRSLNAISLPARVGNAVLSYVLYVFHTLWPFNLCIYYPHPEATLLWWKAAFSLLILAVVTALVLWQARRRPYLCVGWLWYLGTLVPMIGLIQVGSQAIADRYMYIPLVGLGIMAAWGGSEIAALGHKQKIAVAGLGIALVSAMTGATWRQLQYWNSNESLFSRALEITTRNDVAHFNLGIALKRENRLDEARKQFEAATSIRKGYVNALIYLGLIAHETGDYEKAASYYEEAMTSGPSHPSYVDAVCNLGVTRYSQGRYEDAVKQYAKVVQIRPTHADAYYNMGVALSALNRWDEALDAYKKALQIQPDHPYAGPALKSVQQKVADTPAQSKPVIPPEQMPKSAAECYRRGNVAAEKNQMAEASAYFEQAVKLDPNHVDARINLGNALAIQGKWRQAADQFKWVLEKNPKDADALVNYGNVLTELGEYKEALAQYENASKQRPNHVDILNSLGLARAKTGDLKGAEEALSRVLALDPNRANVKQILKQIREELAKR